MAGADNKPSEDGQVRGKSLGLDQLDEWGTEDLDIKRAGDKPEDGLKLPTRAEVEAREAEAAKKAAEDAKANEPEEEDEPVVAEAVQVDDPGEFEPQDYSFEVQTVDAEGKPVKTIKITTIEQWEELLESDPQLGSSLAVNRAFRAAQKMESGMEGDLADYEARKTAYDAARESSEASAADINNKVSEINYLIEKGDLPKVAKEYKDADWSDKTVAEQPGVKEQIELLSYMRDENQRRVKAGLKPMESVLDAFNAMQLDTTRTQLKEAEKEADQARKDAGAKVAGVVPAPVSNVPKGIAVGRVGDLSNLNSGW